MGAKDALKKTASAGLWTTIQVSEILQKYGLTLAKKTGKMMGGVKNLANEFAGGGMNTDIGEDLLDMTISTADWAMDKAIELQNAARGALR